MAYDMEFHGTAMSDMLPPKGEDNSGDDLLRGWMGDDTLMGGPGDDRLAGGPGADNLHGGPDSDTADYTGSMEPVHVDLRSPFSREDDDPGPVYGGDAEGDMLTSIENIWGSPGADTLIGNHVGNMLAGNAGNDMIRGWSGSDHLYGEAGHDVLAGDGGHDVLSGGMGIDELMGGTGNDTLRGGADEDGLYGGDGDDVLEGGAGADMLNGGDGSDTAAYTMSDEAVTINLSRVDDVLKRPEAKGGDATGDEYEKGTIENVRGSDNDDMLTGDKAANMLFGKDSDRYKVAKCIQAEPVFCGFGRSAHSKVISVSVLTKATTCSWAGRATTPCTAAWTTTTSTAAWATTRWSATRATTC